jgi:nucleoside-diphosphate-sugar epimerase
VKKILVTGASGFVGKNLLEYCHDNRLHAEGISVRKGLPRGSLAGIHTVVHLAGKAHDLKNVSQPAEYFEVNTELTQQVFDEFLSSPASVFIFLSSVKAAADVVLDVLTEDDVPSPATVYGKSKLAAEKYLLSKTMPTDKRLYILRPCMIHGPGNKGNLNLLYSLVKKGIPYPLASFENKRSFLSVNNFCFVIRELIEREDIAPGIYNVADNDPLSTNDVIRILSEELGKKARFLRINRSFLKTIAKIGDIMPFPLNTQRLEKLTQNYIVSTKKLQQALKKPLPVKSQEGIRMSARSFALKTN